MKLFNIKYCLLSCSILFCIVSCNNPFAPGLANNIGNTPVLSDQTSIHGVFDNFRYAYIFRDTVVYGHLLDDDFTFVYRNYDQGATDITWGRDEDMRTTSGLFQAARNIDLTWNDTLMVIGDSLLCDVTTGFTLSIEFSALDNVNLHGRANFRLKRQKITNPWKIAIWRDESYE